MNPFYNIVMSQQMNSGNAVAYQALIYTQKATAIMESTRVSEYNQLLQFLQQPGQNTKKDKGSYSECSLNIVGGLCVT